jgi:ABC-type bacteriocin/lantibiotic exporter with double-glycine peptidase domain
MAGCVKKTKRCKQTIDEHMTHPLPRAMKPVIQAEVTGCGIASVAAIAGVSYARAKKISNSLGIFAQDKNLWSETAHVRRLLNHCGFRAKSGELPFRSWHSLPDLALLAIKWHIEKKRPFWHWVVFARDSNGAYVLDSKKALRNHRRTDFGRMKPKWYIDIESKSR